jgi:8-oxo-dGTP pyrophosphatase MutT (NUDIX family)
MHVDETVLAPLRERYGEPVRLEWEGEISEREHSLATYNPNRSHDVTLFIFNGDRLALIRKHGFEPGIWRPPGGGVKPGEDFVAGVQREALEETGLRIELQRYLVEATAHFVYEPYDVPWRTHVFLARTDDDGLGPLDTEEIEAARWGTLPELSGPLRERLLATGRAFWRYRVALHDAAAEALSG